MLTTNVVEKQFGTFYGFEAYFNYVAPFFFCWWPYLFAFVLTATSWLIWPKPLNRAAFWLIVFTLVIHTLALLARIYISGKPPITNLYATAVFIGWGAVIFGLVLEGRSGLKEYVRNEWRLVPLRQFSADSES